MTAHSAAGARNMPASPAHPIILGLEGGGTHTRVLVVDAGNRVLASRHFGPANLSLLDDASLEAIFRNIAAATPRPDALGLGLAGARTDGDRARIRVVAGRVWPGVPCHATNDLETALVAAAPLGRDAEAHILVLSGTGSCCFGRSASGLTRRVGGWGHIIGDQGSGYDIGLRAVCELVQRYDRTDRWPPLGERLLRALLLNEPNDLANWVVEAKKPEVAALAVEVFVAARQRDPLARAILAGAADRLALDATACARHVTRPGRPARFHLAGSVLLKQPAFAREVSRRIRRRWPRARVGLLPRDGVWGAVELARRVISSTKIQPASPASIAAVGGADAIRSRTLSPTEQRNPRSMRLDRISPGAAIELMLREDATIPAALLSEKRTIERALRLIVAALRRGGRLFYVGAGTSGRLGVLDASECPPTFGTDPSRVQGVIAGGQTALWNSVEGAEDDAGAGAAAMRFRGVTRGDVVVGIAASGRTPFVWGALREAKRRQATTVLLCFNPRLIIPRADRPTVVIAPEVGPEILTGSTRLKAGTATKLLLNIFTTLAMVRLGKVISNLMVDVKASNVKLRDRAVRITCELAGASHAAAQAALEATGWNISRACQRLGRRAARAARH